MDKWKEIELEKMNLGGNKNAREFLESQSDYKHSSPLQHKYNSRAAALYRDKLSCLAQGNDWSIETSTAGKAPRNNPSYNNSMEKSKSYSSFQDKSYSNDTSYQNGSNPGYQSYNDPSMKAQTESFFARVQDENASRPDNLPPSQGGRYSGFGNSNYAPPPRSASVDVMDTAVSSLSQGWSLLSLGASRVATKAAEYGNIAAERATTYGQVIGEKVREGKLLEEIGQQATSISGKVTKAAAALSAGQSLSSVLGDQSHKPIGGSQQYEHLERSESSYQNYGADRNSALNSDPGGRRKSNNSWDCDDWDSWSNKEKTKQTSPPGSTFAGFGDDFTSSTKKTESVTPSIEEDNWNNW